MANKKNGSKYKYLLTHYKKVLNRKVLILLPVFLILLIILTRGGQNRELIKTTRVEQKTLTSEISASGNIRSQTSSTLKFASSGKIAWIGVEEGSFIRKGQAIASLEKEPFLVALRQAQQDVNAADAILSQVYDEQKKQTAAENFDQKIRRTNAETAKNKAFDAMRKAQFDLAHSTIYSPQAGVITNLDFIVGEEAGPVSEIAKVNNLTSLNFVVEVDETEITKVKTGQKVKIALDAYPDQIIQAQVEKISPVSKTTSAGATVYEVKIVLPDTNSYLIGMNGQAQIVTQEKPNTQAVPIDAIQDEKYVYVKTDTTFVKREIKTGIQSDTEIEVVEGLAAKEEIVISGFDQIGKKNLWKKVLFR